jgi:hypothetical protein
VSGRQNSIVRICFLVLAHTAPVHYGRLVKALTQSGDYVVTHVDRKSDQRGFELAAPAGDNVHYLVERTDIRWGTWSIMGATLDLFENARALHPDADYYWLLSADTYPIVSMACIHRFLEGRSGTQFMNYKKMPSKDKPMLRISHYRRNYDARTDKYRHLNYIALLFMRRPYRKKLGGRAPFGGSNWVTLSSDAVDFLLDVYHTDKSLVGLAQTSSHPDEFFVQTVLCNSAFRDATAPALFAADFRGTSPNAAVLDRERLAFLKTQSEIQGRTCLVVRKFTDDSSDLIDEIESGWHAAR